MSSYLESCDDRGVPDRSAARDCFGESIFGTSFLFRVDLRLPSIKSCSELLRDVPALLFLGTSPNRNFSLFCFVPFVDVLLWSGCLSSLSARGAGREDDLLPDCARCILSLIRVSSAEGCLPFSWKAMCGVDEELTSRDLESILPLFLLRPK